MLVTLAIVPCDLPVEPEALELTCQRNHVNSDFAFMDDPSRPDISARGLDRCTLGYFAFRESAYPPDQFGWILVLTGIDPPLKPQALTAGEVLRDLASMLPDEDVARGSVQFFTEEMIRALEERSNHLAAAGDDPQAHRKRAEELRSELREALG